MSNVRQNAQLPARLARRRRRQEHEQVAAVCYRLNGHSIDFLLIRTRGGRWTFPKGGTEQGWTTAQVAALEAWEEAGVHGRMEELPFARYTGHKRAAASGAEAIELAVTAHLCAVQWLEPPQESRRNPAWFVAEKAKERLRKNRSPADGVQLSQVIDRAVARIQRLRSSGANKDAFQKVCFDTSSESRMQSEVLDSVSSSRGRSGAEPGQHVIARLVVRTRPYRVLQFAAMPENDGSSAPLPPVQRNRSQQQPGGELQKDLPAMVGPTLIDARRLQGHLVSPPMPSAAAQCNGLAVTREISRVKMRGKKR